MSARKDETGNVYERLTVVSFAGVKLISKGSTVAMWNCLCVCGNTLEVCGSRLRNGNTRSCGCLHKKLLSERSSLHGKSKTPTYLAWKAMRTRCNTPPDKYGYSSYAGKGIGVCDRWEEPSPQGFLNFLEDMGEPLKGQTLDRRDNNVGYSKENCRWVSTGVQNFNKGNCKNTSGKTGVTWIKRRSLWTARINRDGIMIQLGDFVDIEDAIKAREDAEIKYYGRLRGN